MIPCIRVLFIVESNIYVCNFFSRVFFSKKTMSLISVKNGFIHFAQPRLRPRSLSDSRVGEDGGLCRKDSISTADTNRMDETEGDFAESFSEIQTLMVRNIPTRFTSITLLDSLGEFREYIDFMYLPMDFRTGKNMGYCFLNFESCHYAQLFASIYNGTKLGYTTSPKLLSISPSRRQGLAENIELFRKSDLVNCNTIHKPFLRIAQGTPLVSLRRLHMKSDTA